MARFGDCRCGFLLTVWSNGTRVHAHLASPKAICDISLLQVFAHVDFYFAASWASSSMFAQSMQGYLFAGSIHGHVWLLLTGRQEHMSSVLSNFLGYEGVGSLSAWLRLEEFADGEC
jgi:hypothetical protein